MESQSLKYVVGIGEVLWDMLPDGKKLGGAPANFSYHVSQFGLPGCAVSAVGEDALGEEIIANLLDKDLDFSIDKVSYPTGTVEVCLDAAGVPQYDITENAAWDNIPFTPELDALAHRTRAVCFGSLAQRSEVSRNTIRRFLDAMGEDSLVVFDINLRQHFYSEEVITDSMRRCNILKINDEELEIVSRMLELSTSDVDAKCRRLMERFDLKILILTCGVNGSYVFTPDAHYFLPTPIVKVADTVGAGDSFTAAFVASLLKGKSVEEAHATAVETSAYVCSQHGAMPCLPHSLTSGA
ncbi:MAG: carbohydrate kinase [Paramuribaculum sp.]|nr:carbohydrate kinase [Paramuribaculum sp.]